jgi:hypothetical protein
MNRYSVPDIDLRHKLGEMGLACYLLLEANGSGCNGESERTQSFPELLCAELSPLTADAYDGRVLTPAHLQYETWGVVIQTVDAPHQVVAATTLSFTFDIPSYFHTRFEAVHSKHRRTGLGRLLYDCITVWTRFLILNDPLVLDGVLRSSGDYCLVSVIDKDEHDNNDDDNDNEAGHGTFLRKLGFVRALHDFRQDTETEVAFQLAFHIPVGDWFEPAAPATTEREEENPCSAGGNVSTHSLGRTESLLFEAAEVAT